MNEENQSYEVYEWENEEAILKKISTEYEEGFEHVREKRKTKLDEHTYCLMKMYSW